MYTITPTVIKQELDDFVVGQEDAKWALASAYFLYKLRLQNSINSHINSHKTNILLVGPSGCGKTHLIKTLALILCVPYIHVDCSILTSPGFHGIDIFDEIERQDVNFNGDAGIVFLDEFDKISGSRPTERHGDHNRAIQTSLLSLLDGRSVAGSRGKTPKNFDRLFVVAAGAFENLKTVSNYKDNLRQAVINYGIMPELINRFVKVVGLNQLTKDQIYDLCFNISTSPLNSYRYLLKSCGIDFNLTDLEKHQLKKAIEDGQARDLNVILFDFLSVRLKNLKSSGQPINQPPAGDLHD